MSSLEKRDLGLDELEALRLADMLGLSQAEAASMMKVSQPTFNRILATARRTMAECIVNGFAVRIESAETPNSAIHISSAATTRKSCGHQRRRRGA